MNIALFASAFHPSLGGVEELCRQLALELRRNGHHVIVLTNRWPRDLPTQEMLDGIPIYRLPFRTPGGSLKATINYHLSHYLITQRMLLILYENKIDLLHVQCVSNNSYYALIAQDRLKLPLVVTLQGELTMDAARIFERSEFARQTLRDSLSRADLVTACSAKTLADAEAFYGQPLGARARVIFNGVSLADFAAPAANSMRRPSADRLNETPASPCLMRRPDGLNESPDASGLKSKESPNSLRPPQASRLIKGEAAGTSPASLRPPQEGRLIKGEAPGRSPGSLDERIASGEPFVLALGRLAPQKAFDVLIRAYAAAAENSMRRPSADGLNETPASPCLMRRPDGLNESPDASGLESEESPNSSILTPNSQLLTPNSSSSSVKSVKSVDRSPRPHAQCQMLNANCTLPVLLIAGDGPEMANLQNLITELKLSDSVKLIGRADRQQVSALLRGCQFFVLASPAEPFGIVIIEAMAAGAPVIAINNAGPAEIITHGVNGLLVERSEPDLLAAAIKTLAGDPDLRQQLAGAGKARAADFAWPKIAREYAETYSLAISMRRGVAT